MIEIDKIFLLNEEEKRNTTDKYSTQNYEAADLEYRCDIVGEIQAAL